MSAADTESEGWRFWVDRGGTFTDIVARDPSGTLHTRKLLSDRPDQYVDAAIEGIRQLLNDHDTDSRSIAHVKMGTTVATNALLERRGEPTVLLTTRGLADVLQIGTQQRPDLFAIDIKLPPPLYTQVVEAQERLAADGTIVEALDEKCLRQDLNRVVSAGVRSIAIVFMHACVNPVHELQAAAIAKAAGFEQISLSHDVSRLIKIVPRGDTTLVDAYLTPTLQRYVAEIEKGLLAIDSDIALAFMQSHGGLTSATNFRGANSILSGPAGGVVGMAKTSAMAGFNRVIGFDMGGTSTDVSLFDSRYERTSDASIDGIRIATPMLDIHTIAAGGGSIVHFSAGRLQVGPHSAGADPGPAAYKCGGPATLTDANIVLGRVQADHFPAVFGDSNNEALDPGASHARFVELAEQINAASNSLPARPMTPESVAAGALDIAVDKMAQAIRQKSISRGIHPEQFTLACFGGAGGQHACRVADALGIPTVFIHSLDGLLSAYGIGLAEARSVRQQTIDRALNAASVEHARKMGRRLADECAESLDAKTNDGSIEQLLYLRMADSELALPIDFYPQDSVEELLKRFDAAHVSYFGFARAGGSVVLDSMMVETIGPADPASISATSNLDNHPIDADMREIYFAHQRELARVVDRDSLPPSQTLVGPLLIVGAHSSIVVEPGWAVTADASGGLTLKRVAHCTGDRDTVTEADHADPIYLEVFNNAFMHAAQQMGAVLQASARSVNIRERMDFSCAIFNAEGDLIANAPHVPVHLGSMSETVRAVLADNPHKLLPGTAWLSNAPYRGGTHLPDITVISPVFLFGSERLDFIVASRAHHADIGGISPGSMPPFSTSISEEGVVLENLPIVRDDHFLEADVRSALATSPYPARQPDRNIADIMAQLAANARGCKEIARLVTQHGRKLTLQYVRYMRINAAEAVRHALKDVNDGYASVELDTGESIVVAIEVDAGGQSATIDFTGTSHTSSGNLNAPLAIANSAVLYVLRSLVDAEIPLNSGCLDPIRIVVPDGSLLHPKFPAAVVGGNVETSQRIVDALYRALGILASSQGTMNNLTFGNAEHQYYETICGGAGASRNADGANAVHTHMTNSRMTDPEILELRYPVRLEQFAIRHGSGGIGKFSGGDGVIRTLLFLADMNVAILSNCRRIAPHGLAGGGNGATGYNKLIRANGQQIELGGSAEARVTSGDALVIGTPGGGGFGVRGRN